ncbi:terminase small subunit [Paracoccus litorisediminis]|uniref:terminase small subunit n=1 Tax=Paracoccus litorisediminis TaxID=2006130 RepID=UPI003733CB4F
MAKPRELTPKPQLFVQEYLKDLNAVAAARRAGYAEANAVKYAHQLMQLEHVQQAITTAFAARSERTKIDADWVLNRLAEEAEADLADTLEDDGAVKPVKDWPKIWRKGLVAGLDVEEIRNRDGEIEGHARKIKLSDRIKRIELIGKHVNVYPLRRRRFPDRCHPARHRHRRHGDVDCPHERIDRCSTPIRTAGATATPRPACLCGGADCCRHLC